MHKIITDYLRDLGRSDEEIRLYIALVEHGPCTLLQLSRHCGMERTKLYRLADTLSEGGIIEEVPQYKKRTFQAVDVNSIELLVRQRLNQTQSLQNKFSIFSHAMQSLSQQTSGVHVSYYRGVEGLRQMTWHALRCRGLYRTYSYRFWNDIFGDAFTMRLNREFIERKFRVHDLYSDQYLKYKKEWMKRVGKKPGGDWSFWNARYIPEKIVRINQNIDIYNDTVAYAYWEGEDRFGVEIQNQRVADMQKQIHDHLWGMGKRVNELDWKNPRWG